MRDNQVKQVCKLACKRASADCSASVPLKTERGTLCAAVPTASEQGVCHAPTAMIYTPRRDA